MLSHSHGIDRAEERTSRETRQPASPGIAPGANLQLLLHQASAPILRTDAVVLWSGGTDEAILPTFLPLEVGVAQFGQFHAIDDVVQCPACGDVPHDKDPAPVPPTLEVVEEAADSIDSLLPALPAGVWGVEVMTPTG